MDELVYSLKMNEFCIKEYNSVSLNNTSLSVRNGNAFVFSFNVCSFTTKTMIGCGG